VTFAPDGTFWVGDGKNARTLHISPTPSPHVIDQISMQQSTYNISIDQNNPTRVFRNLLEFSVDYSKPLGTTGSWTLVNNWSNLPSVYSSGGANSGFGAVATLANNRTYAQIAHMENNGSGAAVFNGNEIVELTATGVRPTGERTFGTLEGSDQIGSVVNASNGSFEVADTSLYGWAAYPNGAPTTWSATVQNAPETATEGGQYLNLKVTASSSPQPGITLYHSLTGVAGSTYTLSFDFQGKSPGCDLIIATLQAANSLGAPTTSGGASFSPPQDGAWHSYSATITLPPSGTQDFVELRLSFLRNSGYTSGTVYEGNLDNVRVTEGNQVLIDRGTQYWYRSSVTGFDTSGNPTWSDMKPVAGLYDPRPGSAGPMTSNTAAMTATGVLLSYDSSMRDIMHLGGVNQNGTSWAWRAFPTINSPSTTWIYPTGYFDIGAAVVQNSIDRVVTSGRNVVVTYHGESWNRKQASQFMHFYDDGLFVGEFGQAYSQPDGTYLAPDNQGAGFAGNATSPALALYNGETYFYMNDEWGSALQRYHLVGADSIREVKGVGIAGSTIGLVDAPYCPPVGP
jgi:hypothetical protein